MYRRFLNARSPLRLLEKGLHGGLGRGNLGVVLAGPGVGKSSFLVCLALDELLRSERVLHISLDHPVSHVRAYYDTVFEDLASTRHLEQEVLTRQQVDRLRSIRVYPRASLTPARLREAAKIESEAGARPALVIVDGLELADLGRETLSELRALARELDAEIWLSASCRDESVGRIPPALAGVEDLVGVILALEPGSGTVALRALKDHDNPDVSALHVALDPRTLLLVRS